MQQTVATGAKAAFAMNMLPRLVCLVHVLMLSLGGFFLMQGPVAWDARGTRFLALLALGAVSTGHIFGMGWPVTRRGLTGFAVVTLAMASAIAVRTSSGTPRVELLAAAELGVACTLNAAACLLMLQGAARGSLRFSLRIMIVLAVGLTGLGIAVANARGGPAGIWVVALLALSALAALAIGAAALDSASAESNRLREARVSRDLLIGVALSMLAIAAASLAMGGSAMARTPDALSANATWNSAISAARLAWLHVFSTVMALVVVFLRRTALAGLGAFAIAGSSWAILLIGLIPIAWGRIELSASARNIMTIAQQKTIRAEREANLRAEQERKAEPQTPELVTPATELDAGSDAQSDAGSSPEAGDASTGVVRILGVSVDGMHEADAYGGVDRRFNLLEECAARYPEQHGELSAKVSIDITGSATHVVPTNGDLKDAKLGECLMLSFYRMGFASAKDGHSSFEITLRVAR